MTSFTRRTPQPLTTHPPQNHSETHSPHHRPHPATKQSHPPQRCPLQPSSKSTNSTPIPTTHDVYDNYCCEITLPRQPTTTTVSTSPTSLTPESAYIGVNSTSACPPSVFRQENNPGLANSDKSATSNSSSQKLRYDGGTSITTTTNTFPY